MQTLILGMLLGYTKDLILGNLMKIYGYGLWFWSIRSLPSITCHCNLCQFLQLHLYPEYDSLSYFDTALLIFAVIYWFLIWIINCMSKYKNREVICGRSHMINLIFYKIFQTDLYFIITYNITRYDFRGKTYTIL